MLNAYSTWKRIFFHFFSYFSTNRHRRVVFMIWLIRFAWSFAERWYAIIIFKEISHWSNIVVQNSDMNFRFRSFINLIKTFQFLNTYFQYKVFHFSIDIVFFLIRPLCILRNDSSSLICNYFFEKWLKVRL